MRNLPSIITFAVFVNSLTCSLDAQILTNLATYSFLGQPGDQTSTPVNTLATGVSASAITRGPNIGALAVTNTMAATNWSTNNSVWAQRYYEFSLTPDTGFTLSLTSLVVGMARATPNGPTNYAIRSSIDSFASNLFTGITPTSATKVTNFFGSGFNDISNTISFRVYGYNAASPEGRFRLTGSPVTSDTEALVITGTAVPEPSTAVLLLLTLGGLTAISRLRKSSL